MKAVPCAIFLFGMTACEGVKVALGVAAAISYVVAGKVAKAIAAAVGVGVGIGSSEGIAILRKLLNKYGEKIVDVIKVKNLKKFTRWIPPEARQQVEWVVAFVEGMIGVAYDMLSNAVIE